MTSGIENSAIDATPDLILMRGLLSATENILTEPPLHYGAYCACKICSTPRSGFLEARHSQVFQFTSPTKSYTIRAL